MGTSSDFFGTNAHPRLEHHPLVRTRACAPVHDNTGFSQPQDVQNMGESESVKRAPVFGTWRFSSTNNELEFPVFVAQSLFFLACILTVVGFVDCRLVTIAGDLEAIFSNYTAGNVTEFSNMTSTRRGVGLRGWEGPNCTCLCKLDKEEFPYAGYRKATDESWGEARIIVISTIALSWPAFLWLLTYSCVTYSKMNRNILGLVLIVVLSGSQSLGFEILMSPFCQEHNCQFGSTFYMYSGATVLTILSGILLILSNSERRPEPMIKIRTPLDEVCTIDEEERRRDGFSNAREISIEPDLLDPALVATLTGADATTTPTASATEATSAAPNAAVASERSESAAEP